MFQARILFHNHTEIAPVTKTPTHGFQIDNPYTQLAIHRFLSLRQIKQQRNSVIMRQREHRCMTISTAASPPDGHIPFSHVQVFSVFEVTFNTSRLAMINSKYIGHRLGFTRKFRPVNIHVHNHNAGIYTVPGHYGLPFTIFNFVHTPVLYRSRGVHFMSVFHMYVLSAYS